MTSSIPPTPTRFEPFTDRDRMLRSAGIMHLITVGPWVAMALLMVTLPHYSLLVNAGGANACERRATVDERDTFARCSPTFCFWSDHPHSDEA